MTPEKIINSAYEIARNAHPEHFDTFKANWRIFYGPHMADALPVLYNCASLINDALEEMDKKSGKPSKLTAAKHIANNCARENFRGVWTDDQGRSCLCDGFRAVRVSDSFASIPVVPAWPELPRVFSGPEKYTRVLDLPTVTAVKKSAAEQRAAEGRTCRPAFDFGDELPLVSSDYLLDMLALLPGCTAYIADSSADLSPIYFKSESGDGILLPVNKRNRRR